MAKRKRPIKHPTSRGSKKKTAKRPVSKPVKRPKKKAVSNTRKRAPARTKKKALVLRTNRKPKPKLTRAEKERERLKVKLKTEREKVKRKKERAQLKVKRERAKARKEKKKQSDVRRRLEKAEKVFGKLRDELAMLHKDGTPALNPSILRHHADVASIQALLEPYEDSGFQGEDFLELAEALADKYEVPVREIYTLGFSP